jgi:hypothetical protein
VGTSGFGRIPTSGPRLLHFNSIGQSATKSAASAALVFVYLFAQIGESLFLGREVYIANQTVKL